jgi:predicted nucleic acid-binding protein
MNVLIDTNVILDVLLGREPFLSYSAKAVFLSEKNIIDGYVSASTATDIFYIVRKEFQDKDKAYGAMEKLFQAVKVAPIDGETIEKALKLRGNDFEDCIQLVAAHGFEAEYIITRDMDGFNNSTITPSAPSDFLSALEQSET